MAETEFGQPTDEVDERFIDESIQSLTASLGILNVKKQHRQKEPQKKKHEEEKTTTRTSKKRAPKNKLKSHETIRQSKSLLIKNEMHEQVSDEDIAWLASLSENELDMLISYKKIALERATFIQDENLNGIFSFRALRTMGELLKEFINERLKKVQFLAKATATRSISLEKKGGRPYLEEGGECNGIEPNGKTEFDDVAALEIQNVSLEENEGRLPAERVQEYDKIESLVEEELETTATNNLKRKRDFLCGQEEISLKKQKTILNE